MLKDVNDSIEDAKALVRLLKGIPAKINLIPFNPWPGTRYECSDWEQIEKFSQVVFDAGYASPVRTPRGRDILAPAASSRAQPKNYPRENEWRCAPWLWLSNGADIISRKRHASARSDCRHHLRAPTGHRSGRHNSRRRDPPTGMAGHGF